MFQSLPVGHVLPVPGLLLLPPGQRRLPLRLPQRGLGQVGLQRGLHLPHADLLHLEREGEGVGRVEGKGQSVRRSHMDLSEFWASSIMTHSEETDSAISPQIYKGFFPPPPKKKSGNLAQGSSGTFSQMGHSIFFSNFHTCLFFFDPRSLSWREKKKCFKLSVTSGHPPPPQPTTHSS